MDKAKQRPIIDVYGLKRSLSGGPDECGDAFFIRVHEGFCFLGLIDGLGHGKPAHEAAAAAEEFLSAAYEGELTNTMRGLHDRLEGTRGAVAAICRLDLESGLLSYSGLGNISMKIYGENSKRLVSRDGILGYRIPSPRMGRIDMHPGDILIMSSDGVREHFNLLDFPDILRGNAENIAAGFMDKLGKKNDDASCIVMRYGIS